MKITVELLGLGAVRVTFTPHILARILFGRSTVERDADWCGGHWLWSDTGRIVDSVIVDEIRRSIRASRRPRTIAAVLEPPG